MSIGAEALTEAIRPGVDLLDVPTQERLSSSSVVNTLDSIRDSDFGYGQETEAKHSEGFDLRRFGENLFAARLRRQSSTVLLVGEWGADDNFIRGKRVVRAGHWVASRMVFDEQNADSSKALATDLETLHQMANPSRSPRR